MGQGLLVVDSRGGQSRGWVNLGQGTDYELGQIGLICSLSPV